MSFSIKSFEFDAADLVIFGTPILAALVLILIVALHSETLTTDSFFNNEQFIIMPRNCYLKIPEETP